MRRRPSRAVHSIGCNCKNCRTTTVRNYRVDLAVKAFTRLLFLIAAVIAIPFIIANALGNAKGDRR